MGPPGLLHALVYTLYFYRMYSSGITAETKHTVLNVLFHKLQYIVPLQNRIEAMAMCCGKIILNMQYFV